MRRTVYLFAALLLASCGGSKDKIVSNLKIEKFPSVNLKDYDTVSFESKVEFIIPYEYSFSIPKGEGEVLSYSNLEEEIHIKLYEHDKRQFSRIMIAQGDTISSDSLFYAFEKHSYEKLKGSLKSFSQDEHFFAEVNDLLTRYYRISCQSNGFPLEQSLSTRYYEAKDKFYEIRFWSLKKDSDELIDIEDAIMLSFKPVSAAAESVN